MTKTVMRTVRIAGSNKDFGLGPGVLYKDELTVHAASDTMAAMTVINKNRELKDSLLELTMVEL